MDKQKISETEALDIIARVFDRNMRRMNYVRGELFICWGALLSLTALAITAEFYRGKGSQQSGSFAALLMLSVFELIMAFNYTFRMPFDAQGGTWMLELSAHGILLVLLPGFILRHITRKQCSKN